MPVLTGASPSATTTAWCVAVEPIESGKVGKVAVGGVVQLKAADLGKASGAHVLWKDSTWALILIQSGVVRGTFTAPWNKGSAKTVTNAASAGTTYTVQNYFATVPGSGTKACAIASTGGEWILIAAECG
jgi:predicted RecA/RadA family phage recombinase